MITVYGANATIAQLQDIPLNRPSKAGARWKGVQHGDMVNALVTEFHKREWEVLSSQFALDGPKEDKTADMVGAFDLRLPNMDAPEGQEFSLGIMTSNGMRRATKYFVGTKVMVCNNGCSVGEIILHRKHTLNFNLEDAIRPALNEYVIAASKAKDLVAQLRHRDLGQAESDHLLLEAGRRQMLPWSRIGAVDAEYRNPQHSEHGANTSWALLNAFTEVVKRSPVHAQMPAMDKFRDILPLAIAA
jgi:hypothetical protein